MFGSILNLAFVVPDYDFANYGKRGPLVAKTDKPAVVYPSIAESNRLNNPGAALSNG
ncbi:MAG: hypothetical protein ABIV25_11085 [Paracoccaceae bacterium]